MSNEPANYGASGLTPRAQAAAVPVAPKMVELKEPEFVKFNEGDVVEGVLVNIERIQVGNPPKNANRYTIRDPESGELSSFLGSFQIDTKLSPAHLHHYITVRYEGPDASVSRNGNPMKKFRVFASEQPWGGNSPTGNKLADGTFITDDDLGF